MNFWPSKSDYLSLLRREVGADSGLYIGAYEPEFIMQGITRHSIYSDSIVLFDTFLDPRVVAPAMNPLLRPEMFRTATLKNLYLWLSMAPWIDAGLVKIVPSPTHFDAGLALETIRAQRQKLKDHPEIEETIKDSSDYKGQLAQWYRTFALLHTPNERLLEDYAASQPAASSAEVAEFIREIEDLRDSHPYFLRGSLGAGRDQGEITYTSTGESFPIAKLVATLTGSHLITDLPSKWYEIELDRKTSNSQIGWWTPFAKAFQAVDFPFLNKVPLDAALTLRKEERLRGMRDFLRKVWKQSRSDKDFDERNAIELAGELRERIAEAESEWNQIDRDLATWVGGEAVLTGALGVATGDFMAGLPFLVGGVTHLLTARSKRKDFEKCYPAAFFMRLERNARQSR